MTTGIAAWWKNWASDPLLAKEIRTRMRARTVVITGNLYVVAVCAIVLMSVIVAGNVGQALGWEIGSSLFTTLAHTQAFLMLFVSPLVAASAVTGEIEQKTWDSLRAAPVSPARIAATKLAAATGCFLMLILVSLPISGISFILGGVAPAEMLAAYAYTVLCTLTAGAMGLYWSTRFERSIASIPAATITAVLALILASPLGEMGFKSLTMVCPAQFLSALKSDSGVPFFGTELPAWIPSLLLLTTMFVCLVTASVVRLTDERRRRHVVRRATVLALLLLVTVFVCAEQIRPETQEAAIRSSVSSALTRLLVLWAAAGLWFGAGSPVTTSEPRRGPARLLTDPSGFMLLLFAMTLPVLGVSLIAGRAGEPVWRHSLLVFAYPLFMSTLTWTALSRALSGTTGKVRRFVGLAGAAAIALILLIAPLATLSAVSAASEDGVPAAVQFVALLSPMTPVLHGSGAGAHGINLRSVTAILGQDGPAVATGTFYMVAAVLLTAITAFTGKKGRGK